MPLPYHRLRDEEDLDEEMEIMSKYGKEKGFSLRRAAFRLGDIREQLIRRRKTAKSAEPTNGVNKTSDAAEGQKQRPSTSSGRKSSSIGINGTEEVI